MTRGFRGARGSGKDAFDNALRTVAPDIATEDRRIAPVVLIADDDPVCLALCAPSLSALGLTVMTAHSGQAAVESALAVHPALLLLDWYLPGLNACDVRAEVLKTWPAARTNAVWLGMTACDEPATAQSMRNAGFRDVLTKPFSRDSLQQFVQVQCGLLLSMQAAGPELKAQEPRAAFLDGLEALLLDLDRALTQTDWNRCMAILHRIRGSAAQAGFPRFAQSGKELAGLLRKPPDGNQLAGTYLDFLSQAGNLPAGDH